MRQSFISSSLKYIIYITSYFHNIFNSLILITEVSGIKVSERFSNIPTEVRDMFGNF